MKMAIRNNEFISVWLMLLGTMFISQRCFAHQHHHTHSVSFKVDVLSQRSIPQHFFGIFFEEINHAGAGGLWGELVSNRGFEAGGRHVPSMISPWGMIGDEKVVSIITEMSSCFQNNPMALRMDIHCDVTTCPPGGVGIYNPGYWGMNIEEGKTYEIIFFVKSSGPLQVVLSLVNSDGTQVLAFTHKMADAEKVRKWTRIRTSLTATGSDPQARFQLTTTQKGTLWLDQVSVMPTDTFKGHGFRKDLAEMLVNLKPRFLRFPGGCYVEGNTLANAFRWKETVGPWQERPGHRGDVWNYWSDDGLGYLEYLQLAEDLGAEPVWVINNGFGLQDAVDPRLLKPFVQEMLDSIEFARGSPNSTWGSLRARLGHPTPFNLKYIAIGNEDCYKATYRESYMKFYKALKQTYPDIKAISNCDGSQKELDHPADLYDYHNYTSAEGMLQNTHLFDKISRNNPHSPKAFVSEYAVTDPKDKVINGTFKGALAEAAFLLSLEKNSDIVEMVSYAPLFANQNDRLWNPDAIFFNTNKVYGIASYWVQTLFKESSGALLLDSHLHTDTHSNAENIYATAIKWTDNKEKKNYITIKVVNFNKVSAKVNVSLEGIDRNLIRVVSQTVLYSDDLQGDNSFDNPTKVVPQTSRFKAGEKAIDELKVEPYSFTAFDLFY
ncbi:alpha-L-arabinofuranosidase 1-like [Silene latifolia]|uniref:alpha-L-arabinofuranosidase 1-like n=1 Tax=Silene latifolia TaxID=37657 RepID=UPI003D76A7EC